MKNTVSLCFLIQPLPRGKGRNPNKNIVDFLVETKTQNISKLSDLYYKVE